MVELDGLTRLHQRHNEYVAALGELDFDTGAGWFRLDAARDELIGTLGLDPGGDDPDLLAHLLATAEAAHNEHDARCGCTGEACGLGAALAPLTTDESL
jgi:hypothetical protein